MLGININQFLQSAGVITGLLLIGGIVFAESGLLIGFFLPGDTLLFTAGFFAAQGKLPLGWLILVVVLAAVIGDSVGYKIGRRTGHRIFRKKDGLLFRQEYIAKAEAFYEVHGGKTIILARFIPVIRTFAPLIAGVGKMPYRRFLSFNIVGAAIWGASVVLLGHWLGSRIPNIDHYLLPAVLLATVFTFSPMLLHIVHDVELRRKLIGKLKRSPK
ncbi:MAG: VTT domain-containing protein [Candidatus Saccharimonadales bacterium]